MTDSTQPTEVRMSGQARWQQRYDAALAKGLVRDADFTTLSGDAGRPGLRASRSRGGGAAIPGFERIGWPGEYPFTRGLYATGYRGRTWTIRQFAGFGNAEQTNERYKMILAHGGGGSPSPSTCRPSWAATPTSRSAWARSVTAAWRSTRPPTWRSCSRTSRSATSRPP